MVVVYEEDDVDHELMELLLVDDILLEDGGVLEEVDEVLSVEVEGATEENDGDGEKDGEGEAEGENEEDDEDVMVEDDEDDDENALEELDEIVDEGGADDETGSLELEELGIVEEGELLATELENELSLELELTMELAVSELELALDDDDGVIVRELGISEGTDVEFRPKSPPGEVLNDIEDEVAEEGTVGEIDGVGIDKDTMEEVEGVEVLEEPEEPEVVEKTFEIDGGPKFIVKLEFPSSRLFISSLINRENGSMSYIKKIRH